MRHFGEAAEHDHLLVRAAGGDGRDYRTDRGDDRRMAGRHAEIAFHAGDVNLIDFAGEGEFFGGRQQIEVEGGHRESAVSATTEAVVVAGWPSSALEG